MRRAVSLVVLLVALLTAAPGAHAQTAGPIIERAAQALKTDNVYVDPAAERKISDSEADDLRQQIRDSNVPIFIAILPAAAIAEAGDANQVPVALQTATGLAGTYAALAGDSFRSAGPAASIATAAFQARSSEGVAAVLQEFVQDTAAAQTGGAGGAGDLGPASDTNEDSGGGSNVGLLALLGLGGAGIFFWSRSRNRKIRAERERAEAADRQMLQAELSVLADDVVRLEPEVDIHPDARPDYDAAVNRYRAAAAALEYADEPVDLVRVERVIAEARYAMDRARARIDGREPPPPPAELQQPGRHNEPPLEVDERGEPAYAGGGGGFYGGGWFGGGSGLFTGLLLGQMLGGFGGWGGGHHEEHNYYGDSGGDGGGDGGGDWGGGDFGGGDFGGGDF
ncbi:MAG: hypothetical protein QOG87_3569 [Actinomycetota bacterium]